MLSPTRKLTLKSRGQQAHGEGDRWVETAGGGRAGRREPGQQARRATSNQEGNVGSAGRKASISLDGGFQPPFRMLRTRDGAPKLSGHEHKVAVALISQRRGGLKYDHYHHMKESIFIPESRT